VRVVSTIEDLIRLTPNFVVECAGQGAVAEYGEAVLRAGIDLMVISTGALADEEIRDRLTRAGRLSGAHMILPSGAIAGVDGLNSLRIGGLDSVRYTSTKPPLAWKGTPADGNFDLESITERTVLFTGPASQAARDYPKNANLAATVALAGLGMEKTEIQLVADPAVAPNNVGRIDASGQFGTLSVECRGLPAPDNPKTSATTALSLTYAILRGTDTIIL
jgi:aspartate dehydrogenase